MAATGDGPLTPPGEQREDVLQGSDPWAQQSTASQDASAAAAHDAAADASRAARLAAAARTSATSRTYATGERSDAPPMRVIHDNPPSWSGDHPEKELEPYLQLLRGWL